MFRYTRIHFHVDPMFCERTCTNTCISCALHVHVPHSHNLHKCIRACHVHACIFTCTCAHPHLQSTVAGGLCGEEGVVDEKEDSNSPGHNCIPLVAPSDLEDRSAFTSSHQRPVLSRLSKFTNSILKQGAGGVARSGSLASSPNTQRKMVDATVFENE